MTTSVTSKGQVTIPIEFRRALGITEGNMHLPSSYPFKHLLWQLTERLYLPKPLCVNSS